MSKEPKYQVLDSYSKIEVRLYDPFIVAEVEMTGTRKEAIRSGFKILFNYISGQNSTSTKIPMSIPVTEQKVNDRWKIRFMLIQSSYLKDPPHPNHPLIQILSIPHKKFAAIRFSGIPTDKKLAKATQELLGFAKSRQWNLGENPLFAFYNPPWTLPFFRRNEVLVEIV